MRYEQETMSRQEYIRRRRQAQRMVRNLLVTFFLLTLALATVSIVLAFRVHSLSRTVDELREQLTEYQSGTGGPDPIGAGGSADSEGDGSDGGPEEIGQTGGSSAGAVADTEGSEADGSPSLTEPPQTSGAEGTDTAGEDSGAAGEAAQDWSGKKVYLTFDDGPSDLTDDILDVLDRYDVKATFFVVGKTDSQSKKAYQRIVEEGHTLAIHSYTHKYDEIYSSVESFAADFTKLSDLLYEVTGERPRIARFPGGSSNQKAEGGMEPFIRYLKDQGIVYFDWNVENGDATGVSYTAEELAQNALDGIADFQSSVVLMHDMNTKTATLESLPDLLDTLQQNRAQVLVLDETVTPVQHVKAASVE